MTVRRRDVKVTRDRDVFLVFFALRQPSRLDSVWILALMYNVLSGSTGVLTPSGGACCELAKHSTDESNLRKGFKDVQKTCKRREKT